MIREKPDVSRIVILVLLLLALITLVFFFVRMEPLAAGKIRYLDDHWSVKTWDLEFNDITLSDLKLGFVKTGDRIILRNTLPEEETDGAAIQLQTIHAAISVSVDGKPVYADGAQYPAANKMTPSLFHFIALPAGYGGKELQIELWANEDGAFSGISPILTGDVSDLYIYYISAYRITMFISLFLMVTGVLMLFVFFFLWNYYKIEIRVLFSSLLALDLGLYLLCYHELPDFLNTAVSANDFLEYVTLYSIPPLAMAFVACTYTGKQRKIFALLAVIDALIVIVLCVLHALNIVHIDRFVSLCHMIIVIECAILFTVAIRSRQKMAKSQTEQLSWQISDRVLLGSFFIMLAFSMVDIIRFFLRRYFSMVGGRYPNLVFMLTGTMIFVVGLFLNFFYYHIERISAERTTEHLAGLAYTDPLTGMANRGRCDKLLDELNAAGGEYTIVSMDVNYLKRINDTFGHSTGDKYLVDMAAFIRKAFPDAALHGRIGGDEFIVVLNGDVPDTYRACTARLREEIRNKNETSPDIKYGISYGCAFTRETKSRTLQAALEIADARMYEMKRIRHAQEAAHAQ